MIKLLQPQIRRNLFAKVRTSHGLGDETIETRAKRPFTIPLHGRRRQRDNQNRGSLRIAAEFPHQRETIQNRHAKIEQNKKGLSL